MRFGKNNYPLLCDPGFNHAHPKVLGNIIDASEVRSKCLLILNNSGARYVSKLFESEAIANMNKLSSYSNELKDDFFAYCIDGFLIIGVHCNAYLIFSKRRMVGVIYTHYSDQEEEHLEFGFDWDMLETTASDPGELCGHFMTRIKACSLFEKYADIKSKLLPPGKRAKDNNCKYTSDILYPVRLLTENWYTESCRNHPFIVRGHWRMQAHGPQHRERKLIWIDPFTKHGYTKGAYKDK